MVPPETKLKSDSRPWICNVSLNYYLGESTLFPFSLQILAKLMPYPGYKACTFWNRWNITVQQTIKYTGWFLWVRVKLWPSSYSSPFLSLFVLCRSQSGSLISQAPRDSLYSLMFSDTLHLTFPETPHQSQAWLAWKNKSYPMQHAEDNVVYGEGVFGSLPFDSTTEIRSEFDDVAWVMRPTWWGQCTAQNEATHTEYKRPINAGISSAVRGIPPLLCGKCGRHMALNRNWIMSPHFLSNYNDNELFSPIYQKQIKLLLVRKQLQACELAFSMTDFRVCVTNRSKS